MNPRKLASENPQGALVRAELRYLVDERHPLAKLAGEVDWGSLKAPFGQGHSGAGRPGIPEQLMVELPYLKHTFDMRAEAVVQGRVENPYRQSFSGEQYFQYESPSTHPI